MITRMTRNSGGLRATAAAASALALALSLAACGSGSGSSSGSGDTLKVGFANMDTGAISFPNARKGALAAQDYINEELGGIDGRQLELVFCDLENTQQATQACGQKFASDPDIPFALTTLNVYGNGGLNAAMAAKNKPVLGVNGITPADLSDPNALWAYIGNPGTYGNIGKIANRINETEGIDHLSVIHNAGDQSTANGIEQIKTAMDDDITLVDAGVSPNAADFLSAIEAADVTDDSMLQLGIVSPTACVSVAKDLAKLNIKPKLVLGSITCTSAEQIAADPELYENWYFSTSVETWFGDSPENSDDVKLLRQTWDKYGEGNDDFTGGVTHGWAIVMSMQRILEAEKPAELTGEAFKQAIMDYKGPIPLSTGNLNCPGPAPDTSMCNQSQPYYQVKDGVLVLADPING